MPDGSHGWEYGGLETTASTYNGSYVPAGSSSSKYGQSSSRVSPLRTLILPDEMPLMTKFILVRLYVFAFSSCA